MKFKVEMQIKEQFLPNKRCRKERCRYMRNEYEGEITELKEDSFKLAMAVEDYKEAEELRYYDGKLWRAIKASNLICHAEGWATIDNLINCEISNARYAKYDQHDQFIDGISVVTADDSDSVKELLKSRCQQYILFDGKFWQQCGEPMYVVMTFGLGHNHGGTALMIDYYYNDNITKHRYYNALHREEAIKAAKEIAIRRGDTESVDRIGKYYNIIVYDESVVTRCPEKDHGEGNDFINMLDKITENADSSMEAGLLAIAATAHETSN